MKKNIPKNIPYFSGLSLTDKFISVVFALIFFLLPTCAFSADVTLGWDANIEPDLAGYKIYYGTSSGNYSQSVDVGNTTQYTLTGLQDGVTYYFAATAYDDSNNESSYSEELVHTIGSSNNPPQIPTTPTGPSSGYTQTDYSYSTSGTDPDGDLLEYRFDWGDGEMSNWGDAASRTHAFSSAGNFCVKAQAKDSHGATSGWSPCLNVSIALQTHTITASAGENGSISPAGSVTVNHGANQAFSINPNHNYHVTDVVVDGTSVGVVTTYTFNNVTQDHTITASFALDNQAPIADAGPDQTVTEGSVVTLSGINSSDPGGSIVSYYWEQTAGIAVVLSNSESAETTFSAPNVSFAGETLTFKLTVTDNGGLQDADYCTINVTKDEIVDTDGDGVPDDQDAFPNDPDEWEDTDGDGIGNNADADDDNDGMPDDWEIQYGLDPLVDDANEDPDGDGVSNLDEYNAGTNPTVDDYNAAPQIPIIIAPANNDLVSLTPVLQTDEFYDPDPADTHLKTQWQIFDELTDVCVFDVQTATRLTSLTVPKLILDENTVYYCQVRFFDNHGVPSAWSEAIVFQTDINAQDADGNGILDHQELQGFTDMDGDGTDDAQQNDIKCVLTEDGTYFVGISFKDSPTVMAVDAVVSEDPGNLLSNSESNDTPEYMPFGLLNFKLLLTQPEAQAQVTVYLSEPAPEGSKWYKYDAVEATWQDYSAYARLSPDGLSIVLTLQDGGFGDADGTANGIIVDPSGIGAVAASSSDDNSSDNGLMDWADGFSYSCFISAATYDISRLPFVNTVFMGFLLAVLLVAAMIQFKKSKQYKNF